LFGLAAAHPEAALRFCSQTSPVRSLVLERLPANCPGLCFRANPAATYGPLPRPESAAAHAAFAALLLLSRSVVLTEIIPLREFRQRFAEQARPRRRSIRLIIAVSEFNRYPGRAVAWGERHGCGLCNHGVRIPASVQRPREKDHSPCRSDSEEKEYRPAGPAF